MIEIAKVVHGSRLYRLHNEKSDYDFKAIHLPSHGDCYLLRAARNIQKKGEINGVKAEYESFALQEFLALAARGEDVAITMLHVSDDDVLVNNRFFNSLRQNRKFFYTKKMSGMLGYARGMAAKYALRADRMSDVLKVIAILENMRDKGIAKLYQAWDDLPELSHGYHFINQEDRNDDKRAYEIAGKVLPVNISPSYALDILYRLRDSYGERVKAARNMAGQDTKAISHSFRVGYQLLHIYQDGDFSFPLPESDYIRAVKEGRLNYVDDKIDQKLDNLISEVEQKAARSDYPDSVNYGVLDKFVLDAYSNVFVEEF